MLFRSDASALDWVPSADTVTTSWTVTGINGTVGTCEISPSTRQHVNADGTAAVVYAYCPDDGEYVARIDGWDVEGGGSWDTDVDFFVQNAPPSVSIDSPSSGSTTDAGVAVDISATVGDPGVSDTVDCSISWGDGSSEAGTVTDGPPFRRRMMIRAMRFLFSPPEPTERVRHGERIVIGRREWRAVHTPGHTVDHLCLWDPEHGTLLTEIGRAHV